MQQQYNNHPHQYPHRLRSTMAELETHQLSKLIKLRNSYSYNHNPPPITHHKPSQANPGQNISTLKQTLQQLEMKVHKARKQLLFSPKNKKQQFIKPTHQTIKSSCFDDQFTQQSKSLHHDSQLTSNQTKQTYLIETNLNTFRKHKNVIIPTFNKYSPKNYHKYYISELIRSINEKNSIAIEHANSSLKIIKIFECVSYALSNADIESLKLNLKKKQYYKNKKTLVLDLDQTLIHCVENIQHQHDLLLPIHINPTTQINIAINIRPYAITFLKRMATKFQIIVFTASQKSYADVILDQIDPQGQIIQHRLYRQHCYVLPNQMHIKDLRIINRNLNQIVLVDNAPYSYAFQLQNGIPILPFYEGSDNELVALEQYLNILQKVDDVRELNKKVFKFHQYCKYEKAQQLIEQLYKNNNIF